jgi:hypothetical protein
MPRMIELIRASAVPANLVESAAKGALAIPAAEMLEILVYLANENEVFKEQSRLTLAGWNENSAKTIIANPATAKEVLDYFAAPQNLRPSLLPVLLENPALPEPTLAVLAASVDLEAAESILKSQRAEQSLIILQALAANPNVNGIQTEIIKSRMAPLLSRSETPPDPAPEQPESESDDVLDKELMSYLTEHAGEIADQEGPFHAVGGIYDPHAAPAEVPASAAAPGESKPAAGRKDVPSAQEQRGSALQKISKLDVKGRIQLAMKGNKEERSILVRDGTKVVALAVLDSPKITDSEAEMFANQKNVLESLLRGISMKRRFMKNYNVVRNLVFNPRTPMDLSLTLMKNLLVNDLKNLSANKDVPDTIRKLAAKFYRQKKDPSKKSM